MALVRSPTFTDLEVPAPSQQALQLSRCVLHDLDFVLLAARRDVTDDVVVVRQRQRPHPCGWVSVVACGARSRSAAWAQAQAHAVSGDRTAAEPHSPAFTPS